MYIDLLHLDAIRVLEPVILKKECAILDHDLLDIKGARLRRGWAFLFLFDDDWYRPLSVLTDFQFDGWFFKRYGGKGETRFFPLKPINPG